MFNKKIVNYLSATAILALLFSGCGNKEAADNDKKSENQKEIVIETTTENALKYEKLFDRDMTAKIAVGPDGKIDLERNEGYEEYDAALEWEDIVQVSTGYNTVFGLDKSGNVLAACSEATMSYIDLSDFTDISYICATDTGLYALKNDGTVVSTGKYALDVSDWKDVKQISASGENKEIVMGLTNDGTVLVKSDYEEIYEAEKWTDIIQISAGRLHAAGLKSDGTVVTCGRPLFEESGDKGEFDVEEWTDIVYVSADNQTTAGLKKDGTVVITGYNDSEKAKEWTDLISIWQGGNLITGLKSDGTMLNCEFEYDKEYNLLKELETEK